MIREFLLLITGMTLIFSATLGILPFYTLFIIFPLVTISLFENRRFSMTIPLIILLFTSVFLLPQILTQTFQVIGTNTTQTQQNSNTTAWLTTPNSTIPQLFITLLPILLVLTVAFSFVKFALGEDWHDEYGNTTYRYRNDYRDYGYGYATEQSEFEKEILEGDKEFAEGK